jgi:hypothetical protein
MPGIRPQYRRASPLDLQNTIGQEIQPDTVRSLQDDR